MCISPINPSFECAWKWGILVYPPHVQILESKLMTKQFPFFGCHFWVAYFQSLETHWLILQGPPATRYPRRCFPASFQGSTAVEINKIRQALCLFFGNPIPFHGWSGFSIKKTRKGKNLELNKWILRPSLCPFSLLCLLPLVARVRPWGVHVDSTNLVIASPHCWFLDAFGNLVMNKPLKSLSPSPSRRVQLS